MTPTRYFLDGTNPDEDVFEGCSLDGTDALIAPFAVFDSLEQRNVAQSEDRAAMAKMVSKLNADRKWASEVEAEITKLL